MISQERIKEILNKYNEKDKQSYRPYADLFNWCEEYKDFVNNNIGGCVSMEVEYILKKSYEDNDTPLSYEDLDLFDEDKARENILYLFDNDKTEEEQKEFMQEINEEYKRKIKNNGDVEVFLNSLDKEELKNICEKLNIDNQTTDAEIYEWWIVNDPLKYRLEQEGEIFLKGSCVEFWGRRSSGQAISLDRCCINGFINMLKDNYHEEIKEVV